jgi:hypothetical protein
MCQEQVSSFAGCVASVGPLPALKFKFLNDLECTSKGHPARLTIHMAGMMPLQHRPSCILGRRKRRMAA